MGCTLEDGSWSRNFICTWARITRDNLDGLLLGQNDSRGHQVEASQSPKQC